MEPTIGSMDIEKFFKAYELAKYNLINLEITHAFNSIGSHIFFDFGEHKEIILKNGKKTFKWDWTIWFSNTTWRLCKDGKYIVGSNDPSTLIEKSIQKLLGKRLQSLYFISQFLDVTINFEDGYQLVSFFNWFSERQWLVLVPDNNNLKINCANYKEIRETRTIAKHFQIIENFKECDILSEKVSLTNILFKEWGRPIFKFGKKIILDLKFCKWRLEREENYLVGHTDFALSKHKNKIHTLMNELIGKKLIKIKLNEFQEAKFEFEDNFVIQTFACLRSTLQWGLFSKDLPPFYGKINLAKEET